MILPNGALVAVIDGERMRLFRNVGHEPRIRLTALPVPHLRVGNTGSGSRHRSSSANPDGARINEDDFTAAAAAYLNRDVLRGASGKVLIIADRRTLGELRKHFHPALYPKLLGEIPKDLTSHSEKEIQAAIVAA